MGHRAAGSNELNSLVLQRIKEDGRLTVGVLTLQGAGGCFIGEPGTDPDGPQRILAGTYPIIIRKEPSKFDAEATKMLGSVYIGMVQFVVPGRSEIEIHWGNFSDDTEGCLMTGTNYANGPVPDRAYSGLYLLNSRDAWKLVYPVIAQAVLSGGAEIVINDIQQSFAA